MQSRRLGPSTERRPEQNCGRHGNPSPLSQSPSARLPMALLLACETKLKNAGVNSAAIRGRPLGSMGRGTSGGQHSPWTTVCGGGGMQPHTPYDCRLHRSGATKLANNLRPQQSSPSTRNAGDANGIARLGDFLRFLSGLFLRVSVPPLSNGVGWVATCPCAFPEAYVSFSCT